MSTTETTERQFAHGADKFEGCDCPAVAAGFDPQEDNVVVVASRYDIEIEGPRASTGLVSEEEAKEAWLDAIDYLEESDHGSVSHEAYKVVENLGWVSE